MIKYFIDPSNEYRPKPFWFWNGHITQQEIDRQLLEMKEKGIGGVFVCPRQGMDVPYLSAEWFRLIQYAASRAEEIGLEVWLYDEFPYPSGMSGGEVTLRLPQAKQMVLDYFCKECIGGKVSMELGWGNILYAKACPLSAEGDICYERAVDLIEEIGNEQPQVIFQESGLTEYNTRRFFTYGPQKKLVCTLPKGKWKLMLFLERELEDFKYYGCFMDPCNREAVKAFLETTYEKYKACLGEKFGSQVLGMFTDETGLLGNLPWSHLLPEEFKKEHGYSLAENLCALADASYPNAYQIRYDLYLTIHHLLRENYHHQISDWCKENHLNYIAEVPGMRMTTQLYSHIVGGDFSHEKLGKPLNWIYDNGIFNFRHNPRAIASFARQLGRKYALIESFHSVGWSMTLQDAKWMIDRLAAAGINMFNFHAFYYTIDGLSKCDAPPSQFLQNPYWEHYKLFADYVGRISAAFTQTSSACSIAVLDPVASFWIYLGNPFEGFSYGGYDPTEKQRLETLKEDWNYLCKTLLHHQIDYEHLDPEMFAKASVDDGVIRIGNACYDLLILPPCVCMEKDAGEKLQKFIDNGGKVIALGILPHLAIDGDSDPRAIYEKMFQVKICPQDYWSGRQAYSVYKHPLRQVYTFSTQGPVKESGVEREFLDAVRRLSPVKALFTAPNHNLASFITHLRTDQEGGVWAFITNQEGQEVQGQLTLAKNKYLAEKYDLETGDISPIPVKGGCIPLHFAPYQSYLIRMSQGTGALQQQEIQKSQLVIDTSKEMHMELFGNNIYRIDHFLFSRDQETWRSVEVKTFLEQAVESGSICTGDIAFHGGFGLPKRMTFSYPLTCYYKTQFSVYEVPDNLSVMMDKGTISGEFSMFVNGHSFTRENFHESYVNDFNNIACPISKAVKTGINELCFIVTVEQDWDGILDTVFLTGNFALEKTAQGTFSIHSPKSCGKISLTYQDGYPFFSGTIVYSGAFFVDLHNLHSRFQLRLDIGDQLFDCIKVTVNEVSLGVRAFTPYVWEGDRFILCQGANRIRIEITNTLVNMLEGRYFDYPSQKLISM